MNPSDQTPLPTRASALHQAFINAPRDLAPLPYWLWNGSIQEDELLRQVDAIESAGCAGLIICARHGLRTPYLSPEWIRLVGVACQAARKRGLQAWIADSENWPGAVGPAPGDAWRLKISRHPASGPGALHIEIPGVALGVCAIPALPDPEALRPGDRFDLTALLQGNRLEWDPPSSAPYEILSFSAIRYPHADLLAPGAGDGLIRSTHARYEEALGDLQAAGVTGFYSDEIAPISVWNVPDPQALPWTPDMATALSDEQGSLLDALMPLAVDAADAWPARQRFWELVADLYLTRLFAPIREWLTHRQLLWAGHLLFEEPLIAQVMCQANFPAALRQFDLPVVDNLQLSRPGLEQNLTSSIAHLSGKQAASESFGGAGWGRSLADRRHAVDLQAVRGADRLIPHGLFYTTAGKRKLDSPPCEFLREPFAPAYPIFASYVRRLGWALSQGRPGAHVALFYPLRSVWATLTLADGQEQARILEEDLELSASLLEQSQYEYQLVDEEDLRQATIVGDRLRIGAFDFAILAIPSCPCIGRLAWRRILELLDNGGRILALGMIPEGFENGPDRDLQAKLMQLAAVEASAIRQAYRLHARSHVAGQEVFTYTYRSPAGGRFSAFQAALSADAEFARGEIRQILNSYCPPDVECRNPDLRCRRRSLGGLDLFWLVLESAAPAEVRVGLRGHGSPEIWDLATGARQPLFQYSWAGANQTVVTLRLEPHEGVLVALPPVEHEHLEGANFVVESVRRDGDRVAVDGYHDPGAAVRAVATLTGPPQAIWHPALREPARLQASDPAAVYTLDLEDEWDFQRLDANTLVLNEWRFHRDERGAGRLMGWHRRPHPDWHILPARRPLPWFPELEPLEASPPAWAWFEATYAVRDWLPSRRFWLALESIDAPFRCWVDGDEVAPAPPGCPGCPATRADVLSDPGWLWANLSEHSLPGRHTVTILADYRGVPTLAPNNRQRIPVDLVPAPARLAGDFAVHGHPPGLAITAREPAGMKAGSWARAGYPHYSGAARIRRQVLIPAEWRDCRLFLEIKQVAGVLSAAVNNHPLGILPWPPFQFDVTSFLQPGETGLIEMQIRNTLANALLGRPDDSGPLAGIRLRGLPRVHLQ